MKHPTIALVSTHSARDLDEDLHPLQTALNALGCEVHVVDWEDANADWSKFELALLRSPWNYTMHLPEFLAWAERTAAQTLLLNPLPIIRWNTDKHYLAELARHGVPVVPGEFVEPGDDVTAILDRFVLSQDAREFVVKPAVGAGSRDAQRHASERRDDAISHARRLLDTNRSVLLQPYLDRVDVQGETALIFFAGNFSHAIRKGPLLHRNQGPTRALFAPEHITAREPDGDEMQVALQALAAIGAPQPLLYARVDIIRDQDGKPCVLELELTEPSLFFSHSEGSAQRFAATILARVREDPRR